MLNVDHLESRSTDQSDSIRQVVKLDIDACNGVCSSARSVDNVMYEVKVIGVLAKCWPAWTFSLLFLPTSQPAVLAGAGAQGRQGRGAHMLCGLVHRSRWST